MFGIVDDSICNVIIVAFDTDNNKIVITNSEITIFEACDDTATLDQAYGISNGFAYLTCDSKGENVSSLPFGSFIIKTRATNDNTNASGDTPKAGDVVTLSGSSVGSVVSLNFSNYDFNNLIPGVLFQKDGDAQNGIASEDSWVEGSDNEFTNELYDTYNPALPTFLEIMQDDTTIDTIPVSVVVQ